MGMFDLPSDFATITLTDTNERTLCKFIKEKAGSQWCVAGEPESKKHYRRLVERIQKGEPPPPRNPGHRKRFRLVNLADGRQRLDVPGPLLPWDANTHAALDRLHAVFGDMKITVDQLHVCITEH